MSKAPLSVEEFAKLVGPACTHGGGVICRQCSLRAAYRAALELFQRERLAAERDRTLRQESEGKAGSLQQQLTTALAANQVYAEAISELVNDTVVVWPTAGEQETYLITTSQLAPLVALVATPPSGAELATLRRDNGELYAALVAAETYINDHYRFADGSVRPANAEVEVLGVIRAAFDREALAETNQRAEYAWSLAQSMIPPEALAVAEQSLAEAQAENTRLRGALAKATETLIWASAWVKVGRPVLDELLALAATPPTGTELATLREALEAIAALEGSEGITDAVFAERTLALVNAVLGAPVEEGRL